MENYKSVRGSGMYYIFGISLAYNLLLIALIFLVNSYEASLFLKIALIVFNIYQFYYIVICTSLKFSIDDDNIYISSWLKLKNIKVSFKDIEAYQKAHGNIKGVKLSGYGKNHFAIGRALINKIGTTYMFVTSTQNIIYLKTQDMNYGISPENFDSFEKVLNEKGVKESPWEHKGVSNVNLYKDKKFFVPFIISAVIVMLITLNPLIMYLYNKLPSMMPLNFDAHFVAIKFGTGKQFAFKHTIYGVLNMALLVSMYHAAYFCAKYDKNSAYKFIYMPLVISAVFLIMQIKILMIFR